MLQNRLPATTSPNTPAATMKIVSPIMMIKHSTIIPEISMKMAYIPLMKRKMNPFGMEIQRKKNLFLFMIIVIILKRMMKKKIIKIIYTQR